MAKKSSKMQQFPCPLCGGLSPARKSWCPECNGFGRVERPKNFDIYAKHGIKVEEFSALKGTIEVNTLPDGKQVIRLGLPAGYHCREDGKDHVEILVQAEDVLKVNTGSKFAETVAHALWWYVARAS